MAKKPEMSSHRVSVLEALQAYGYASVNEWLDSHQAFDSVVPACCDLGCEVEPDGRCQHGCPAVTRALGVI